MVAIRLLNPVASATASMILVTSDITAFTPLVKLQKPSLLSFKAVSNPVFIPAAAEDPPSAPFVAAVPAMAVPIAAAT